MPQFRHLLLLAVFLPVSGFTDSPLTIAVASNFKSTVDEIIIEFTRTTNIPVRVSAASTGKLYAQVIHGAPFDIFLAADSKRPALLEEQGYAVKGTRTTYAIGTLVLWSADRKLSAANCRAVLDTGAFRKLAIANPASAPYGRAAHEFLVSAGLWDEVSSRVVYGENISQTLQFVATGNATLGLIATSQTRSDRALVHSCSWDVPAAAHSEIAQQAVLISSSPKLVAAARFLEFLRSPAAVEILRRRGYGIPQ